LKRWRPKNNEDNAQAYNEGLSALNTADNIRGFLVFVLITVPAYLAEADAATIIMSGLGGVFVFAIISYLYYCYTAKSREPRWLRERRNRRKSLHKNHHR
jgi:hypothetical protein